MPGHTARKSPSTSAAPSHRDSLKGRAAVARWGLSCTAPRGAGAACSPALRVPGGHKPRAHLGTGALLRGPCEPRQCRASRRAGRILPALACLGCVGMGRASPEPQQSRWLRFSPCSHTSASLQLAFLTRRAGNAAWARCSRPGAAQEIPPGHPGFLLPTLTSALLPCGGVRAANGVMARGPCRVRVAGALSPTASSSTGLRAHPGAPELDKAPSFIIQSYCCGWKRFTGD